MWDRVINKISRMWEIIFWLNPDCVIEKIKIKIKLDRKYRSTKHVLQKLHFNKKGKGRRKLCRNYVRKYLAYRAQLNFQNADTAIAALKPEASVTSAATYYFSTIKGNAWMRLVILLLIPWPAALRLKVD